MSCPRWSASLACARSATARPCGSCRLTYHAEPVGRSAMACWPGGRRPMSISPQPGRPDASDPRYAGLPLGDGTIGRFLARAPTADSASLADGYLRATGWRVHKVGLARSAVGPNGMRWIYRWLIVGPESEAT